MKKPGAPARFTCEACHKPTVGLWDVYSKAQLRIQSVCADCTGTLRAKGWRRLRHDSAGQVEAVKVGDIDPKIQQSLTALPPGDRE